MKAFLKVLVLVLLFASSVHAQGCVTTQNGVWWSAAITTTSYTGNFTVTFDVAPASLTADMVVGVSSGTPSTYTNLAAIVRFGSPSSGMIQAMNGAAGDSYQPATGGPTYTVPAAGSYYHVEFDVRMATHTYDAYVTAPGASAKTVIGMNFSFRSPSASIGSINAIGGETGQSTGQICNIVATQNATVPVLQSLQPSSITVQPVGTNPVTVNLTGTNFTSSSVVNVNGVSAAPYYTYISPTNMTMTFGGGAITTPANFNVTVTNSGPGGGTSNILVFTVLAASSNPPNPPTVTSIAASLTVGIACATTAPPPSAHSVVLTWNASSTSQVTSYNVYRSTTNTGNAYTKIGSATLLTYMDNTVTNGVSYYYVVTAVAPACPSPVTASTPPCGESVYSNQASASIP